MTTKEQAKAEQLILAAAEQTQKAGHKPGDITEVSDLGGNQAVAKLQIETPQEAMGAYLRYYNDFINLSGGNLTSRQAMRVLRAYAGMPFKDPVIKDPLEALMLNALIMASDAKYKFISLVQEEKRSKLNTMTPTEKVEEFTKIKKEVESE